MGELTGTTFIFFLVFAAVLVVMYVLTRRALAPVGLVALIGSIINVVMIALISWGTGNNPLQIVFVSLGIGVLFSVASVAMALYFRSNDPVPPETPKTMQ
jgi:ABC-type Fe3+-siderophore transport system permease subunit